MNDGRMKILEMLQEGKITVEEADRLLKQFPGDDNEKNDFSGRLKGATGEIWEELKDVGCDIKEAFENIEEDIKEAFEDMDEDSHIKITLGNIFGREEKKYFSFQSSTVPEAINSLKLLGKNGHVKIEGYDGNVVKIEGEYRPKSGREVNVTFSEENNDFEILYDYNAVRYMKICAQVPRVAISHLHGESSNSLVSMTDLDAANVVLMTKNAPIKIKGVAAPHLQASTSNAPIDMQKVQAKSIDLVTSNARIELEDVTAEEAKLKTSNGPINIDATDIKQLFTKTSNGGIKLRDIIKKADADDTGNEYAIEAHTTNSGIKISLPQEVGYKIQASTSVGRVDSNISNFYFSDKEKDYLNGKSDGYENFKQKAKINLSTSNGSIKIEEQ